MPIDRNEHARQLGIDPLMLGAAYGPPLQSPAIAAPPPPVATPFVAPTQINPMISGALNLDVPSGASSAAPIQIVPELTKQQLESIGMKHTAPASRGVDPGTGLDIFKAPSDWQQTSSEPVVQKKAPVFAKGEGGAGLGGLGGLMPRFAGPSVIPGHEVRRVSPETEKLLRKAGSEEQEAAKAKTAAEVALIGGEAQGAMDVAAARDEQRRLSEARESHRQAIIDQHLENQANLADDIRNFKIDPSHAFGEGVEGAFRRIGALIGVTLGGYAAGLRGGPNMAAQMIDGWIDKDIDAQKSELAKRQGLLGESRSLLAQKMAQFGDQRVAEAAAKADILEGVKAQTEAHLAGAKSDLQRANGDLLLAAIDEKIGKQNDAIMGWQGPQKMAGDPRQAKFVELKKWAQEHGDTPQMAEIRAAQTLGMLPSSIPLPAFPGKKGGAGKMQAIISRLAGLKTIRGELHNEIAAVEKGTNASREDWNASETRHAVLPGALASAIDGSASDEKVKLYKEALGSPIGTFGAINQTPRLAKLRSVLKTVDEAEKNLRSEIQSFSEGRGGEGGESEDEQGGLETAQPLE